MEDFLKFRKFITPMIIQILFWIGVGVVVLAGLGAMIGGIAGGGIGVFLIGLLWVILGPIAVRIQCELLILAFRVLDLLQEIRHNTEQPGGTA